MTITEVLYECVKAAIVIVNVGYAIIFSAYIAKKIGRMFFNDN